MSYPINNTQIYFIENLAVWICPGIVKIFSWFAKTTKKNNTKYHDFTVHLAHTQLAVVLSAGVATYFARDGLRVRYSQMNHGKRVSQLSPYPIIVHPYCHMQHVYTVFLGTLSHARNWPKPAR